MDGDAEDEEDAAPDFYADFWAAGAWARLAGVAGGAAGLDNEIAALRALLRGVLGDKTLEPVARLLAFGRGVDVLVRVSRLRQQIAEAAPADVETLNTVLKRLGLGPEAGPAGHGG